MITTSIQDVDVQIHLFTWNTQNRLLPLVTSNFDFSSILPEFHSHPDVDLRYKTPATDHFSTFLGNAHPLLHPHTFQCPRLVALIKEVKHPQHA